MVVSSSKGAILPTTMADLFVSNGYRTAYNGTAWSAFSFVADYFGFNEYYSTSDINTMLTYLGRDNNGDGISDYFVVASCGSGLFTTGGHYIMLADLNGSTISVFDPYLYNGKFDTASRRGKVTVSGNTVYCSVGNFNAYANYKNFWIYSNDSGNGTSVPQPSQVSYTRYVATQSLNLNVRNNPNGAIIGSLPKGTQVTVYDTVDGWSRIGDSRWVSSAYLSSTPVAVATNTSSKKTITGYRTGTYRTTANLHVRTGASTKYRAKTYRELTANARSQNKRLGNYYYNGYKKGVVCTVTKVNGNWGLTRSRMDLLRLL
jgi:SH3-like domain-containing protein